MKLWEVLNGNKTELGVIITSLVVLLQELGVRLSPRAEDALVKLALALLAVGLAHRAVKRAKGGA